MTELPLVGNYSLNVVDAWIFIFKEIIRIYSKWVCDVVMFFFSFSFSYKFFIYSAMLFSVLSFNRFESFDKKKNEEKSWGKFMVSQIFSWVISKKKLNLKWWNIHKRLAFFKVCKQMRIHTSWGIQFRDRTKLVLK